MNLWMIEWVDGYMNNGINESLRVYVSDIGESNKWSKEGIDL